MMKSIKDEPEFESPPDSLLILTPEGAAWLILSYLICHQEALYVWFALMSRSTSLTLSRGCVGSCFKIEGLRVFPASSRYGCRHQSLHLQWLPDLT